MIDAETKRYIDQQIDTLRREMRAAGVIGGSSDSGPRTVAYAVSAGAAGYAANAGSASYAVYAGSAETAITASTAGYVELTEGSANVHITGTTIAVDDPSENAEEET